MSIFVGAINRVGVEDLATTAFTVRRYFVNRRGRSSGDAASDSDDEVIVRDLDMSVLSDVRRTWAFYRDRRPDSYGDWSLPSYGEALGRR